MDNTLNVSITAGFLKACHTLFFNNLVNGSDNILEEAKKIFNENKDDILRDSLITILVTYLAIKFQNKNKNNRITGILNFI